MLIALLVPAFAAQHACMRIAAAPARLEFTSYHLSDGAFACGGFLPGGPDHATTHLDEGQRGFKRELMTLYVSQRHVLAQFAPDIERFRVAPQYDFAQPPHAPPLHYELYAWGMDGAAFRSLATDAALTLTTEDGCP